MLQSQCFGTIPVLVKSQNLSGDSEKVSNKRKAVIKLNLTIVVPFRLVFTNFHISHLVSQIRDSVNKYFYDTCQDKSS